MASRSKGKIFAIILVAILLTGAIGAVVAYSKYSNAIKPVSGASKEVNFTVEDDMTGNDVIAKLYSEGLIQSELAAKIYMKLNHVDGIIAGNFLLNRNMSLEEILAVLTDESNAIIEQVEFMIVPGQWAKDAAASIAEVTDLTATEIMNKWNDVNYIDELMKKYEFITEDVLASEHCYLEGFLTPETYYVYKTATVEEITEKILDQHQIIYDKYKGQLAETDFNYFELVTLASVIQFEAKTVEDMKLVSGVFHNRFKDGWLMQSSVTVCYALYDDYHSWEDCERNPDLDSPYNTYMYEGLPVGPICNPNENAINAALNPTASDYYYFIANVNTVDMYFAKTFSEHQYNIDHYMY